MTAKLRVIIADDERPARSFLAAILRRFKDVTVVGEAANGAEAVKLIEQERPDMAFLDLQMASSRFIRLGRGTIVNLEMVKKIVPLPGGTYTVILTNNQEFNASRIQSRIIRDQLLRL